MARKPEPKMPLCTGTTAKGTPRKQHRWSFPWQMNEDKTELSRSCRRCGVTEVFGANNNRTFRYVAAAKGD